MQHESAAVLFTRTKHPLLSREALDAAQSGDTDVAAKMLPYNEIAILFNDPTLPLRNLCCKYAEDGSKTSDMAEP
jgi:hypothetical protein